MITLMRWLTTVYICHWTAKSRGAWPAAFISLHQRKSKFRYPWQRPVSILVLSPDSTNHTHSDCTPERSFKRLTPDSNKTTFSLSVANVNVNSITHKLYFLWSLLEHYLVSLIGISESCLLHTISLSFVTLPCFVLLRKDVICITPKHGVCLHIVSF